MGTITSIPPRNISFLLFVQSQTYLPSLFVTVEPWRPSNFFKLQSEWILLFRYLKATYYVLICTESNVFAITICDCWSLILILQRPTHTCALFRTINAISHNCRSQILQTVGRVHSPKSSLSRSSQIKISAV